MTDHPRFQKIMGDVDTSYDRYHGAPVVAFVLGLADRWRRSRSGIALPSKQAFPRRLSAMMVGSVALIILAGMAFAKETVRIRGTIERMDGSTYVVRSRDGRIHSLALATDASVAASVKSSIDDIRPGLTSVLRSCRNPTGACERWKRTSFTRPCGATSEGHRAWDLLPKSTMTNAVVEEIVSAVDGHSINLRYTGGQQRIAMPSATTVVTYLPGTIGELQPGAVVFVPSAVKQPDGRLRVDRVMVGRDIAPPQ